jgi:protoheme IX farnesyltransferase
MAEYDRGISFVRRSPPRMDSHGGSQALLSYLFLYTPLKRKTPLCVLIGAFPGAMPPLIGWAAASGKLKAEACILYAILFLWQFPHFMAIAWMYREDYDRAGYFVPPQSQARDRFVVL